MLANFCPECNKEVSLTNITDKCPICRGICIQCEIHDEHRLPSVRSTILLETLGQQQQQGRVRRSVLTPTTMEAIQRETPETPTVSSQQINHPLPDMVQEGLEELPGDLLLQDNQHHIQQFLSHFRSFMDTFNLSLSLPPLGPILFVKEIQKIYCTEDLNLTQLFSRVQIRHQLSTDILPLSLEQIGQQQRILIMLRDLRLELECSICQCNFEDSSDRLGMQLTCGHIFHQDCIIHWFRVTGSCPYCRQDLTQEQGSMCTPEAN